MTSTTFGFAPRRLTANVNYDWVIEQLCRTDPVNGEIWCSGMRQAVRSSPGENAPPVPDKDGRWRYRIHHGGEGRGVIVQVAAAVVLATSAVAIIVAWHRHERGRDALPAKIEAERLRHLREAQFPSTCSWCKSTAIGNQVLVFERHGTNWRASDLMAQLQTCPDKNVDALASILSSEQAAWRRFCAEKCVREFLAAAPISAQVAFVDCAGCGASYPASLGRCGSCDVSAPLLR